MQTPFTPPRWAASTAATLALALALAGCGNTLAAPRAAEWQFTVRLDGKPIGTHGFVLANAADGRVAVSSEATFDVTLLGVPLYRYRHRVSERWAEGCLAFIDARTDDDGRLTEVRGQVQDGRFDLQVQDGGTASSGPAAPPACLMSFAYWNPALAGQRQLLDPASGRIEPVTISPLATVPADLKPQATRGIRISGLAHPIDVWYVGDRWVGLDTTVRNGRRLSYRLH